MSEMNDSKPKLMNCLSSRSTMHSLSAETSVTKATQDIKLDIVSISVSLAQNSGTSFNLKLHKAIMDCKW